LLKKGDSWSDSIGWHNTGGRSASERALLGAYGTGARPVINAGGNNGITQFGVLSNLAVVGIRFSGSSPGAGVFMILRSSQNLLFEDLYINNFNNGFSLQSEGGGYDITYYILNASIRRSIIVDTSGDHAQGIYAVGVRGITLEDNLFDHNGWSSSADRTSFSHNIYLDAEGGVNGTLRGNIVSRGAYVGAQIRFDSKVENNLFLNNPIGFFVRSSIDENDQTGEYRPWGYLGPFTADILVKDNVVLGSDDFTPNPSFEPTAMETYAVRQSAVIMNNIFTNTLASGGTGISIYQDSNNVQVSQKNVLIKNNIVYNYGISLVGGESYGTRQNYTISDNVFQTTASLPVVSYSNARNDITYRSNTYYSPLAAGSWFDVDGVNRNLAGWQSLYGETNPQTGPVSFPDPSRNIVSYQASIGATATFNAFIAGARAQSKDNWDPRYTAAAVNSYIRAGFGR
jgi:hypothetical protein